MKVKELIAKLQQFDPEAEICAYAGWLLDEIEELHHYYTGPTPQDLKAKLSVTFKRPKDWY